MTSESEESEEYSESSIANLNIHLVSAAFTEFAAYFAIIVILRNLSIQSLTFNRLPLENVARPLNMP